MPEGRRAVFHAPLVVLSIEWINFNPGHLKWDYEYSIGDLKPDVVQAPLWHQPFVPEEARGLLRDYEETRAVRTPAPARTETRETTRPGS